MAASIFVRSEAQRSGPQPFDAGLHMRQVAQLVGKVFANELDDRGRGALREMEFAGRLSPFLGGVTSLALFSDELYGYVWIEDSRVVGNVTLQQGDDPGCAGALPTWRCSAGVSGPRHRSNADAGDTARNCRAGRRLGHPRCTPATIWPTGCIWTWVSPTCAGDGSWRLPALPACTPGPIRGLCSEPLRTLTGSESLDLAARLPSAISAMDRAAQSRGYQLSLGRLVGEALGHWTRACRVERWAYWEHGRLLARWRQG